MSSIFVIGEDALSCALGTRLVDQVLGWKLAQPAIDTKGITKLISSLERYANLSRLHPVLCVADTDGKCVSELLSRLIPQGAPHNFLLRFAITESESWALADHEAFASYLDVPGSKVPGRPDELEDAKLQVISLARRSRKRNLKRE